jgi:hypothetical protein
MERARGVKDLESVPAGEKERATDVARDLENQVETTGAADRAALDKDAGHRGPAARMLENRRLGNY